MLTARDLSYGLYGAWRLTLLDRNAGRYFDTSIDGFWKSFYAAAIAAPGVIIVTALIVAQVGLPDHVGYPSFILAKAAQYVISWVLFPLVMATVSDLLQRGEQYIGFVVAFNWWQVVEMAVSLPLFLLIIASGASAQEPNTVVNLLLLAVAFYYWFIARTMLRISGWSAVAVVAINLTLAGGLEIATKAVLY